MARKKSEELTASDIHRTVGGGIRVVSAISGYWKKMTRPSTLLVVLAVVGGVQVDGLDMSWLRELSPKERAVGMVILALVIAVSVLWERFIDQAMWQRTEMADIIKANTAAMTTNTLHHLTAHQQTDEKLEDLIEAERRASARLQRVESACGLASDETAEIRLSNGSKVAGLEKLPADATTRKYHHG